MRNTISYILISVVFAVFIGFVMGAFSPFFGLAILAFFIFISLTIANLRYGIIFWILTGGIFVAPLYTFRRAGIYPTVLVLSLLFIFWILLALETKKLFITQSKLFWPLISLIVITLFSTVKGWVLYDPYVLGEHRYVLVQIFASIIILFSVFVTFLIQQYFNTRKQIYLVYLSVIILGLEVFIFELLSLNKFGFIFIWTPILKAHALALAYAGLLFIPKIELWKKILFYLVVIVSIQYVVGQFFLEGEQWITGWIGICIPLAYITFQKSKSWSVFLVILFCVLIFTLANDKINNMFVQAEKEGDYNRFYMWETSMEIWKTNPFLGVGPGNFLDYSLAYAPLKRAYTSSHNQYLQILVELGLLGLICFTWMIVNISLLGRYLLKKVKDNFLKAFIIGIMGTFYGQIIACFFGDYIFPAYHNKGTLTFSVTVYFWILVGSLMAIEQQVKKDEEKAKWD